MRPELDAALAAVAAAQTAIARGGSDQITSKGGRDLVTAADVAAEDAIRRKLLQCYPEYPVVGEERGGEPPAGGGPYWLVDPICGTRLFASGIPLYAINVTLVEGGQAVASAVGDGSNGKIYVTERGMGAWAVTDDGRVPIRATDSEPILWVATGSTKSGDWKYCEAGFVGAALLADRWVVWMVGTTLALAYVAAGRIAAYMQFIGSGPLHTAAGCLLASEAGATVTDLAGEPMTLASGALLAAATPELHRDLLELVDESRASAGA